MKKRVDVLLVEKCKVSSRTRAQDLIKAESVWVFLAGQWVQVRAANQIFEDSVEIEIRENELNRYVSRGGLKLEGALKELKFSVENLNAIDVGMSTGGFTDCLLKSGVQRVVGVDVGHGQLHPALRNHPQVISIEGVNARELDRHPGVQNARPPQGWDLAVVDVSFISLTLILPALVGVLKPQGFILALVKPQFEVGPENLGKGGLVQNMGLFSSVETKIREKCLELDLHVRHYLRSSIEGKDGNREFFIFAQKK